MFVPLARDLCCVVGHTCHSQVPRDHSLGHKSVQGEVIMRPVNDSRDKVPCKAAECSRLSHSKLVARQLNWRDLVGAVG